MAAKLLHFPKARRYYCSNAHLVKGPEQFERCAFCGENLCAHDLSCRCTCKASQQSPPRTFHYVPPTYRVEK